MRQKVLKFTALTVECVLLDNEFKNLIFNHHVAVCYHNLIDLKCPFRNLFENFQNRLLGAPLIGVNDDVNSGNKGEME